jgi:hypothetical protein
VEMVGFSNSDRSSDLKRARDEKLWERRRLRGTNAACGIWIRPEFMKKSSDR